MNPGTPLEFSIGAKPPGTTSVAAMAGPQGGFFVAYNNGEFTAADIAVSFNALINVPRSYMLGGVPPPQYVLGAVSNVSKTAAPTGQTQPDTGDQPQDLRDKDQVTQSCKDPTKKENNQNWVVRGGEAKVKDLLDPKAYRQHLGVTDTDIYGLSVQYDPGTNRTVEELACAGEFRNPVVRYALDTELQLAGLTVGRIVTLLKTPGKGYHHTLSALGVQELPENLANALSAAWAIRPKMTNPCRKIGF